MTESNSATSRGNLKRLALFLSALYTPPAPSPQPDQKCVQHLLGLCSLLGLCQGVKLVRRCHVSFSEPQEGSG